MNDNKKKGKASIINYPPEKIEKIETELDNIKLEGEDTDIEKEKEKPTFTIPNYSMIEYLQDKNKQIQNKQTIYEYYYESLNEIYSRISICIIVFLSLINFSGRIGKNPQPIPEPTSIFFFLFFTVLISFINSIRL